MLKYVIVSPVRNEEEFIETTIKSVINQDHLPSEFIIVDDGSTDSTPEIIQRYTSIYNWIKVVHRPKGEHRPGGGVVEAFYAGFDIIETKDWNFVIKLDGDVEFAPDYFSKQIERFEENPKLGISSGKTYQPKGNKLVLDKMPDDHTRGPAKMYKRDCWNDIGGLPRVLGWDTLDELKAQVLGWETRSFADLKLIHFKPIGYKQKKIVKREVKAGERQHYLGYHPAFALSRGIYRMFQKPYLIAGVLNIYGFIAAELQNTDQIKDKEIIHHLRKKQIDRLTFKRKLIG
jgi:glycosyltransferase involved in cell wall biosynthesis